MTLTLDMESVADLPWNLKQLKVHCRRESKVKLVVPQMSQESAPLLREHLVAANVVRYLPQKAN